MNNIERVLVVSTGHLTKEEADTELAILNRSTLSREEGFMIHTRLDEPAEEDQLERWGEEQVLTDSARSVFTIARAIGCEWVLFDCDGEALAGVDTHD